MVKLSLSRGPPSGPLASDPSFPSRLLPASRCFRSTRQQETDRNVCVCVCAAATHVLLDVDFCDIAPQARRHKHVVQTFRALAHLGWDVCWTEPRRRHGNSELVRVNSADHGLYRLHLRTAIFSHRRVRQLMRSGFPELVHVSVNPHKNMMANVVGLPMSQTCKKRQEALCFPRCIPQGGAKVRKIRADESH